MAYGGINILIYAAAEIGKNPSSKDQNQLSLEDDHADAGRDG